MVKLFSKSATPQFCITLYLYIKVNKTLFTTKGTFYDTHRFDVYYTHTLYKFL